MNLDHLFRNAREERVELEERGPLEDEPQLEEPGDGPTADLSQQDIPPFLFQPPSTRSSSQPLRAEVAVSLAMSSPSSPAPRSPSLPPTKAEPSPPRGAVLADGLTREEYRRMKKREKERDARRVNRQKQQMAIGESLKAAAKKHRANAAALRADFAMLPDNVHIARTGVVGKAMRAKPEDAKTMPLKKATKLGFQYVSWSGKCVCHPPTVECLSRLTVPAGTHASWWTLTNESSAHCCLARMTRTGRTSSTGQRSSLHGRSRSLLRWSPNRTIAGVRTSLRRLEPPWVADRRCVELCTRYRIPRRTFHISGSATSRIPRFGSACSTS